MHNEPAPEDPTAVLISDLVARLYLDKFGKGPLRTETFVNGDVITTLMYDVFTSAERSMVGDGNVDSVLSTRMHWQSATDGEFRSVVAKATGRSVLAAISGFDPIHDLASEVFVLAPK